MPTRVEDERFLRRAIRLAMNGRGRVEPNPMVGCVLVRDGRVIGEGWHEQFGGPHAEPNALAACTESPEGATAYVTLEPCCHTNKKTPPCAPRLIEARVKRVVLGCTDPNPDVDGKGLALLRDAGIEVTPGVIENECRQLVAPFLAGIRQQRPYVTLKWAETADKKIAGPGGTRTQISGPESTRVVHELRGRSHYIVVGINTVLNDDPSLTARDVDLNNYPTPVVLDTRLRLPLSARVVQNITGQGDIIVYCSKAAGRRIVVNDADKLRDVGAGVGLVDGGADGHLSLPQVLEDLGRGLHAMVEPGPTLARAFFTANLVDRVWVIRSPKTIAEPTAPSAAPIPSHYVETGSIQLGLDTLTEYLNAQSPVFSAATPSADFVLTREKYNPGVTAY